MKDGGVWRAESWARRWRSCSRPRPTRAFCFSSVRYSARFSEWFWRTIFSSDAEDTSRPERIIGKTYWYPVGFQSLGLRGLGGGIRILSSPSAAVGLGFLHPQPPGSGLPLSGSHGPFPRAALGPDTPGIGVLAKFPTEKEGAPSVQSGGKGGRSQ